MYQTTLALLLFLFPLAYSPGPGNMFFAANGARFGLRATLMANLGYHVATWIVTAAIGFGFLTTVQATPGLFAAMRLIGAAYVFWIAWNMLRANAPTLMQSAQPARFHDGAILLLLNPKAYVIIALMFTQFLPVQTNGDHMAILFITTVFTLNNFCAFILWTLIGDRIAQRLRSAATAQAVNTGFAILMAGVAVWMLFI